MSKLIVLTGASRGLGAAIGENLVASGYRVVGLSRKGEGPSGIDHRKCDVGDPSAVAQALGDVQKDAALYGLINAAGVASMNLVVSTPAPTAERVIRVNLLGTIHCCSALAKRFMRNKTGRIINFSTIAVPLGLKGEAIYVASKAGVEGFSRTFAREMADFGVTVNTIAPGPMDTALIAGIAPAKIAAIIERQIIQQPLGPPEVLDLVDFLLSSKSRMLSGQVLNIGGA